MAPGQGPREDRGAQPLRIRQTERGSRLSAELRIAPASIQAQGWGWRHAGRSSWAARDLDFAIAPGERVLLLGASGAGKTTLIHALAGVLGGDDEGESAGSLLIDGVEPEAARGRAGLVLQDPDSQVILARVGDDVAFGCENLGVPAERIWPRVAAALDAVGLDLPLGHPTSSLSGGQKQRLALAGVLAMEPGLLLLDEPTANLDPEGVVEVRDSVLRSIDRTGATLVVIEHRVEVWMHVVDRVIVLDARGGVLSDGPVAEVLDREGARLAAAGVWVPGHPPDRPTRNRSAGSRVLVESEGLSIGRRPGAVLAADIHVELSTGRATAVTGRNGSGKSTLGLTLGGLIPPLAGSILAPGLAGAAHTQPIRWKSSELLTRIGTVFQNPEHQFLSSTVRDELAVGPRALGQGAAQIMETVESLADRLRLTKLLEANPFTLSGGEKRRLSVATALATAPPLLVLDEPTFGQDSRTWQELVALLAELLDAGSAVLAITHDADFVEALANSELRLDASGLTVIR